MQWSRRSESEENRKKRTNAHLGPTSLSGSLPMRKNALVNKMELGSSVRSTFRCSVAVVRSSRTVGRFFCGPIDRWSRAIVASYGFAVRAFCLSFPSHFQHGRLSTSSSFLLSFPSAANNLRVPTLPPPPRNLLRVHLSTYRMVYLLSTLFLILFLFLFLLPAFRYPCNVVDGQHFAQTLSSTRRVEIVLTNSFRGWRIYQSESYNSSRFADPARFDLPGTRRHLDLNNRVPKGFCDILQSCYRFRPQL